MIVKNYTQKICFKYVFIHVLLTFYRTGSFLTVSTISLGPSYLLITEFRTTVSLTAISLAWFTIRNTCQNWFIAKNQGGNDDKQDCQLLHCKSKSLYIILIYKKFRKYIPYLILVLTFQQVLLLVIHECATLYIGKFVVRLFVKYLKRIIRIAEKTKVFLNNKQYNVLLEIIQRNLNKFYIEMCIRI